mmetsp:Transcript_51893/g.150768  ORF Transcript_51893/g.150768 Transcript_51893/m.150768 type:complete len:320 (+) Transcript_51893:501-1460(+)
MHDILLDIREEWSRAVVALVVGTATLVQQQVPIDPSFGPVAEIFDDVLRVPLRELPVPAVRAALLARLRHDEVLLRPQLVHSEHVVEAELPQLVRPALEAGVTVPVEGHAPDMPGSLLVGVDHPRPGEHVVAVVVPDQELEVQAAELQYGAQEVPHEVALLLRCEEAALPVHRRVRLVLHGQRPQRQTTSLQLLGKLHVVPGPGLPVLRLEVASSHHAAGVLHPRRWTPGASHDLERLPRGSASAVHEGDDGPPIAADREGLELLVANLLAAGPVASGEVAGVDVHAAHPVAESRVDAEACVDHLLLPHAPQLQKKLGR